MSLSRNELIESLKGVLDEHSNDDDSLALFVVSEENTSLSGLLSTYDFCCVIGAAYSHICKIEGVEIANGVLLQMMDESSEEVDTSEYC